MKTNLTRMSMIICAAWLLGCGGSATTYGANSPATGGDVHVTTEAELNQNKHESTTTHPGDSDE